MAENLFKILWGMQPREAADAIVGPSKEEKVKILIEDFLDKLPEQFSIAELMGKVKHHSVSVEKREQYLCAKQSPKGLELRIGIHRLDAELDR